MRAALVLEEEASRDTSGFVVAVMVGCGQIAVFVKVSEDDIPCPSCACLIDEWGLSGCGQMVNHQMHRLTSLRFAWLVIVYV